MGCVRASVCVCVFFCCVCVCVSLSLSVSVSMGVRPPRLRKFRISCFSRTILWVCGSREGGIYERARGTQGGGGRGLTNKAVQGSRLARHAVFEWCRREHQPSRTPSMPVPYRWGSSLWDLRCTLSWADSFIDTGQLFQCQSALPGSLTIRAVFLPGGSGDCYTDGSLCNAPGTLSAFVVRAQCTALLTRSISYLVLGQCCKC